MEPALKNALPRIIELCKEHRIRELWVFGSAAVEGGKYFDPAKSDYDFVVDFMDDDLGPWMKKYFDFKDALEALLGRQVDLAMKGGLRKPYVHASVEATKVPLYAAA